MGEPPGLLKSDTLPQQQAFVSIGNAAGAYRYEGFVVKRPSGRFCSLQGLAVQYPITLRHSITKTPTPRRIKPTGSMLTSIPNPPTITQAQKNRFPLVSAFMLTHSQEQTR